MGTEQDSEWMTVQDVASYLKVNEETVRRWIRDGDLEVLSLGTSNRAGYRILKSALDTFIKERYGRMGKAAA